MLEKQGDINAPCVVMLGLIGLWPAAKSELMTTETDPENSEETPGISFAEFLTNHPPNQKTSILDLKAYYGRQGNASFYGLNLPDLLLHCDSEACGGTRFFRCINVPKQDHSHYRINVFLSYVCANCSATSKTYALEIKGNSSHPPNGDLSGTATKFGEFPTFGPPTPSRLITLIGPDKDAFLKGRRCENQGLGIGAFVYYRRVVENQKSRILLQIHKVAEKIGFSQDKLEILLAAGKETQFSRAMDMAKDALPESLLINGHNPLRLLHSALSEGVHEMKDAECLEMAGNIRVVLGELSDRLSQALKDDEGIKNALTSLMLRHSSKGKATATDPAALDQTDHPPS